MIDVGYSSILFSALTSTLLLVNLSSTKLPNPSLPQVATNADFKPSFTAFTATFVGEPPKYLLYALVVCTVLLASSPIKSNNTSPTHKISIVFNLNKFYLLFYRLSK